MIENLINLIRAILKFLINPNVITIIIICIILYFLNQNKGKKHFKNITPPINIENENTYYNDPWRKEEKQTINRLTEYTNSYEPKYLMTLNEKSQFRKLQEWALGRGFIVFSKVRLLDLITPRKGQNNYKGLLWKIQAKHVDFVICDKDIRIKCIIEINDNSHKRTDRHERDQFVAEVLTACGYKVMQTYNITNEQLDQICNINQSTADEQNQP